jgi:hypothetical protein
MLHGKNQAVYIERVLSIRYIRCGHCKAFAPVCGINTIALLMIYLLLEMESSGSKFSRQGRRYHCKGGRFDQQTIELKVISCLIMNSTSMLTLDMA